MTSKKINETLKLQAEAGKKLLDLELINLEHN
jgi:hypothetical protein